jgi:hypothetical protein
MNNTPSGQEKKASPKVREGTSRTNYSGKFAILKIGREP